MFLRAILIAQICLYATSAFALDPCQTNYRLLTAYNRVREWARDNLGRQLVVSPEERAQRDRALAGFWKGDEGQQLAKKYVWKDFGKDLAARVQKRLDRELNSQQRVMKDLRDANDVTEMIGMIAQSEAEGLHAQHQSLEAGARVKAVEKAIYGDQEWTDYMLPQGQARRATLEILRHQLEGSGSRKFLHEMTPAQQQAAVQKAYHEMKRRLDLATKFVSEREAELQGKMNINPRVFRRLVLDEIQRRLTPESADGKKLPARDLPTDVAEQKKLMDEVMKEMTTQIAFINEALEEGIALTGNPWNWWIRANKQYYLQKIAEMLGDDLAREGKSMLSMRIPERRALAQAFSDIALTNIRGALNTRVTGLGVGLPIGLALGAPHIFPAPAMQGINMILPIITGPLTFGVNYWMGIKLKPYVALKNAERNQAAAKTKLQAELEAIAKSATGLTDIHKDGANMEKDQSNLVHQALDIAARTRDDVEAAEVIAIGLQRASQNYAQVKVLPRQSAILYYRALKDRFGTPAKIELLKRKLAEHAKEMEQDPAIATAYIDQIFTPTSLTQAPPKPVELKEANEYVGHAMRKASDTRDDDLALDDVADLAFVMGSPRYENVYLSPLILRPYQRDLTRRLGGDEKYAKAQALVKKKCEDEKIDPTKPLERLERILRPKPENLDLGLIMGQTP